MNKQELLACIDNLGLPNYKYIVLAGGSMVLHGLRDETNDLDLCVYETVALQLGLSGMSPNEKGYYALNEHTDVMVGLDKINSEVVEVGNGRKVLCQSLKSVLEFKKWRNAPKDQTDIELIQGYFTEQGRS